MKKRSIVAVLLLTFITCGIYTFFWMYLTRDEVKNYLKDASIEPGLEVLLTILCFPYTYYWLYKCSKDIVKAEVKAGVAAPADNALLNIVLAAFGLFPVCMLIIQSQLNTIIDQPPAETV